YIAVDGVLLVVWGSVVERALGRLRGPLVRWLNRLSGSLMLAAAALLALKEIDTPPRP
ncbi:MAG: LysE family translocator, partial [Inquilinus sp.]|nr:LysE family translocator [Inquilinus sp.]